MCSLLPSSVTVDRHVFVQTGYWCKKVYWSFMWFGCYWGLVSSITKLYVASIGIYEKFASAFIKAVQSLHVGNGLEESTSQVRSSTNYHFHHDKWSSSISICFSCVCCLNSVLLSKFMSCLNLILQSLPNFHSHSSVAMHWFFWCALFSILFT